MTKIHAPTALFMLAFKNTLASILKMRDVPEIGVMDRAKWGGDAVLMQIGGAGCSTAMRQAHDRFLTGIGSGTLAAATAATAAAAARLWRIGSCRACCRRCRF